jgi:DNA topoisomerase-2
MQLVPLRIGRKKKSVLVEELESMGFDRMTKTQKVAAAAAAEEFAEEGSEEALDAGASYDYLLSMPLWNLTQEKVDDLMGEQAAKTTEVKELHNTTVGAV